MLDTLQIPIGVAVLSVVFQPLWGYATRKDHVSMDRGSSSFSFKRVIEANGGIRAFGFYTARFAALVGLVVLSRGYLGKSGCLNGSSIYQIECSKTLISWTYVSTKLPFFIGTWKIINGTTFFQIYTTVLAGAALLSTTHWRVIASRSVGIITFAAWSVYIHRDIWPLVTYNLKPQDNAEGVVLWYKMALLSFAAVVVPILVPRKYMPVDSKVC